jgi:signal transduction histidine kinase
VSGTAALLPNLARNQGRNRLFWAFMTLAVVFWLGYQLLWTYFEVILRQDVPDPFVGDIILFLHVVPMMAALALQPHAEQDNHTSRLGSLDFALLLISWVYLYFFAVVPWQYAYTDELTYSHNYNALYLTEKTVFLLGLAIVWRRSRRPWRTLYLNWFGASLMYSLSSYVANWAIAKRVYYTGSLYDVPLAISMAWVTAIGLLAQDSLPERILTRESKRHGVWVARVGMVAILSLPAFAAWSIFDSRTPPQVRTFRMVVTLITMMVMGWMVFLRQHLLDQELIRLLHTSQESFANLKRLQAQLIHSEKLASLGQLVGGAAHEINNPLTAMLGYSDLLAATPLSDEQRSLTKKIGQQVRRTKALVSSLLSFAKQVPAEKVRVDINLLAQTAIRLAPPQLRTRNIEIKLQLASPAPAVWGDSNLLLQVFLHIVSNAIHAMDGGGSGLLTIRTQSLNGSVIIEFLDSGTGMVQPDRVFDPFYTTKPVGQGTGLGLSACYGIIQEHEGRILCQNREEGGAIFRIELPALKAPAGDGNSSQPAHTTGASTALEKQPTTPLPLHSNS